MAAAGAQWRQPAWQRRRQLGRSAFLAVAAARLEMRRRCGGGGGNNGALAAAAWRMLIMILIVTMTMIIDRGGRKGVGESWLHVLLVAVAMDGDDNCNGDCLSKKELDKEKGEKEFKDGFVFFMLSYFVIVFWLIFFNAGQLFLLLLLCAAVTIMVKKRLVNSVTFFHIL